MAEIHGFRTIRAQRLQGLGKKLRNVFLILALLALALLAFRQTDSMVTLAFFNPRPGAPPLPAEARPAAFDTPEGHHLTGCWLSPSRPHKGGPLVLYLHGRYGNVGIQYNQYRWLAQDLGLEVFALDYRGYGLSPGRPSRSGCLQDSLDALAWLQSQRPGQSIAVVGHSMGASLSLMLASKAHGIERVLALAPFSTFRAMGQVRVEQCGFPKAFASGLAWLMVPSGIEPLDGVTTLGPPVMLAHGDRDDKVPQEQSRILKASSKGLVRFLGLPGYGHEDFDQGALGKVFLLEAGNFLYGK